MSTTPQTEGVAAIEHECYWTRRRRTLLMRTEIGIGGLGIPAAVLLRVVRLLDETYRPQCDQEDPYTFLVHIGDIRCSLHDGCILSVDGPSCAFERALLQSVIEMHAHYLQAAGLPAAATNTVRYLLQDGVSVDIRSLPAKQMLRLRAFDTGSPWWKRLQSPVHDYPALSASASRLCGILARVSQGHGAAAQLSAAEAEQMDSSIDQLLASIRRHGNWRQAERDLQQMAYAQEALASLAFTHRVPLTDRQGRIVKEFDRSDDPELLARTFESIKAGKWP